MSNHLFATAYGKAVVCMVAAYISIALMGVFVKYASEGLPSSEILFVRFVIGFVFLLPFLMRDHDFKINLRQWHLFVLRNLAGIVSMFLTFYVIKFLPLSIAVLLMNTSALFVPLLLFMLRVKTPLKAMSCCLTGFVGVSVILFMPHQENIDPYYISVGLGAAVLAAMAFISLQELNKHNSPKNIVFYFHLLGSILLPLFFFRQWKWPTVDELVLLLSVGFFGLIFQLLLTRAFKYAPANLITPFTFTGVIASGLFDWLFWRNIPDFNFWLGSLIIIVSISLLARMKTKKT